MTAAPEQEEPVVRPFAEFLVQQGNGSTHTELSEALHNLVAAVKETGKAGSVVLKVDVKPMSKRDDHALIITAGVAVKAPRGEAPTSVFFIDDDGNLSRNDPRQMTFGELREVEERRAAKDPKALKEATK